MRNHLCTGLIFALATPTLAAADITVNEAFARSSSAMAQSGAAFMEIVNSGDTSDRLVSASSDIAERVELHTHESDAHGVMRMIEVEEGFEIGARETLLLDRGGLHVMFLGLQSPMNEGDMIDVTLTFEQAGDIELSIPVDLERASVGGAAPHGDHHHHGDGHGHGHDHDHGDGHDSHGHDGHGHGHDH